MATDFAPAVYEHAAALIGERPWTASRDGALLQAAHRAAYDRYRHAPVVVGIDLYNLEAEAYGATVAEPDGNGIPAISDHPCEDFEEVAALPPLDPATAGRIPMLIAAAKALAAERPEADVRVPVAGPFSIACNLMGFETALCELVAEPEDAAEALAHLVKGQTAFVGAIRAAGLQPALFESGAAPPLVSPALFAEVIAPALTGLMDAIEPMLGARPACIIGGNTAPIIEPILATGARYLICPSETDQAAFMAAARDRTEVRIRINMDPGVLVRGEESRITAEIDRLLALAGDRPNTCIGAGVLPYETPPAHVDRARALLEARLGASEPDKA